MTKKQQIEIRCPSCGAMEGERHINDCAMESCPFCGMWLAYCNCMYEKLDIPREYDHGNCFAKEGIPTEQWAEYETQWAQMLEEKGREPYLLVPILCPLCGEKFPLIFHVDDWEKYVPPQLQKKVLCYGCYNKLKGLFPDGWRNVKQHERTEEEQRLSDMVTIQISPALLKEYPFLSEFHNKTGKEIREMSPSGARSKR